MHKETYELQRIQDNCSDFLQIIADIMNRKPPKPTKTLRDIYQDQFININEQQLKGIYNDRARTIGKVQRQKTKV